MNLGLHGAKLTPESAVIPKEGWAESSVVKKPRRTLSSLYMRSGNVYKLSGKNRTGSRIVITVHVGKDGLLKDVRELVVEPNHKFT